jgi:hypothetical protein
MVLLAAQAEKHDPPADHPNKQTVLKTVPTKCWKGRSMFHVNLTKLKHDH